MNHYFAVSSERQLLSDSLKNDLELVFNTTAWGFREILLVITIARTLDRTYLASSSFYKCNPRALYEGPIRSELLKRGIPHKKSGPLNVAKATVGINSQWAAQRRPAIVAEKVVSLVSQIERFKKNKLDYFMKYLFFRFLKEASRIATLSVNLKPESDPKFLFDLSSAMIRQAPDGGNSPQRIIGLLLQSYHEDLQTGIKVLGHEDSASTTSTTSKKPGDITESSLDETFIKIYEVTVKPFSYSRVEDSYEAVIKYSDLSGIKIYEVVVICRKEDIHPKLINSANGTIYFGKLEYQDLTYHFANIFDWIMNQLLRMDTDARLTFYLKLNSYVSNPNTSEKVKLFWQNYHSNKN